MIITHHLLLIYTLIFVSASASASASDLDLDLESPSPSPLLLPLHYNDDASSDYGFISLTPVTSNDNLITIQTAASMSPSKLLGAKQPVFPSQLPNHDNDMATARSRKNSTPASPTAADSGETDYYDDIEANIIDHEHTHMIAVAGATDNFLVAIFRRYFCCFLPDPCFNCVGLFCALMFCCFQCLFLRIYHQFKSISSTFKVK